MPIVTNCECGQRIKASRKHAGKKVRCPSCGSVQRLPAGAQGEASAGDAGGGAGGGSGGGGSAGGGVLDAPSPVQRSTGTQSRRSEGRESNPQATDDATCPECGQSVKPGAVICVGCGFNLKAGQKMQTDVDEADGPAAADAPKRHPNAFIITGIIILASFALGAVVEIVHLIADREFGFLRNLPGILAIMLTGQILKLRVGEMMPRPLRWQVAGLFVGFSFLLLAVDVLVLGGFLFEPPPNAPALGVLGIAALIFAVVGVPLTYFLLWLGER